MCRKNEKVSGSTREVLSQINTDSMTEDDVESEQEELSSEIIQESSRNNLTWVGVNEDDPKSVAGRRMKIS